MKEQIKSQVLKLLSGYCFQEKRPDFPTISILSPWVSDVDLEIDEEIFKTDELHFGQDYGIASINLPYALLCLAFDYDAHITIVTLPPTQENYKDSWYAHASLLDFLDEIGCSVYVNPDLHSKLYLSNDLALLGSFNLSIPALYGREEIGILIDDMESLRVLENYASDVIQSSKRYGTRIEEVHTPVNFHGVQLNGQGLVTSKVTRGWLMEDIFRNSDASGRESHLYTVVNFVAGTNYTFDLAKKVASDLEGFYVKVLRYILENGFISKEARSEYLKSRFGFQGRSEIDEMLEFLKSRFARERIPRINPRIIPVKALVG